MPKLLALRANCPSPLFEELEKFLKLLASKRQVGIEPEESTSKQNPEPDGIEWPLYPARQNSPLYTFAARERSRLGIPSAYEKLMEQYKNLESNHDMLMNANKKLSNENFNQSLIISKYRSAAIQSESRSLDWDRMHQSSSNSLLQKWRAETFAAMEFEKGIKK